MRYLITNLPMGLGDEKLPFDGTLAAVFGGWGFPVQTAPNAREAFESLAQDDVGLVVLDHELVQPDPGRWREVWRGLPRRVALVAMTSATTNEDTLRFLRDSARVLVPPPFDLCQIRHAAITALGEPF